MNLVTSLSDGSLYSTPELNQSTRGILESLDFDRKTFEIKVMTVKLIVQNK